MDTFEVVHWAMDTYFPDIAVACSMQDAVLVDVVTKVEPRVEVFFLETGFHFPETLEVADAIEARYGINLVRLRPEINAAVYSRDGLDACCFARKVEPLNRYLATKKAWVSGIRRAESVLRALARPVEWDETRSIAKINPLVDWTDHEVQEYIDANDIIVNPLRLQGYDSIGCAPCTLPGSGREGRWSGSAKTECGIHTIGTRP